MNVTEAFDKAFSGFDMNPREYHQELATFSLGWSAAEENCAELLQALQVVESKLTYLQKLWGKEGVTDGLVDQIRAAIQKATGAQ